MAKQDSKVKLSYNEFVCGWGASAINISVTFPMNKVMFRQQLHGYRTLKAVDQVYREGILKLYRGVAPPFCQKTLTYSIMFGMYNYFCRLLQSTTDFPSALTRSSAAILAGCTEALLLPFERIQTLMQDRHYHKHFRNTIHAVKEVRLYGAREYYRGLSAVLCRNGPSNCVFFLGRDYIRERLPPRQTRVGTITADFVSGGLLGALISTSCFPLNVAKTRMQSRLGGDFLSIREALKEVLSERDGKLRKLFRGVHLNYSRSLLSWGIINASYEVLKEALQKKDAYDDVT